MAQKSAPAAADPAWAAFEAEALPHLDRLFRLAMWFERNRSEAEDLVQETMMQALQSFHRFRPGTNCRAWLTTILQNVRSNRRRGAVDHCSLTIRTTGSATRLPLYRRCHRS